MTFPFQHFVINHKELKLNKSLISQVKNITFFFLMKILKLKKKIKVKNITIISNCTLGLSNIKHIPM